MKYATPTAWLVATCLLLVGCANPPAAKYQGEIDEALTTRPAQAVHAAAPSAVSPQPWKVGQWALYREDFEGETGYRRVAVVRQDDCGIWLERTEVAPTQRMVTSICFERMPHVYDDINRTIDEGIRLVRLVRAKRNDGPVKVLDTSTELGAALLDIRRRMWQQVRFQTRLDFAAMPRTDVVVPAGIFAQSFELRSSANIGTMQQAFHGWIHPAVPVTGVVRSDTSELLAFDQSGAHPTI